MRGAVPGLPCAKAHSVYHLTLSGTANSQIDCVSLAGVPADHTVDFYITIASGAVVESASDEFGAFLGDTPGYGLAIDGLMGGSNVYITNNGTIQTHGGRGGDGYGGLAFGGSANFRGGGGGGGRGIGAAPGGTGYAGSGTPGTNGNNGSTAFGGTGGTNNTDPPSEAFFQPATIDGPGRGGFPIILGTNVVNPDLAVPLQTLCFCYFDNTNGSVLTGGAGGLGGINRSAGGISDPQDGEDYGGDVVGNNGAVLIESGASWTVYDPDGVGYSSSNPVPNWPNSGINTNRFGVATTSFSGPVP